MLTHDAGDLHLVVEGTARKVTDGATLARASAAFATAYDWPTRVGDGRLDADYGAPTSGGPPYDVYEVTPTKDRLRGEPVTVRPPDQRCRAP